jgi:hypothetical protein
MKFNVMLHDNWIEYFMAWTQICMVVYIFNEMHKTFLQLELVTYYFWTFKAIDVSYNRLCESLFTKNKLFLKFQSHELIKHIIYNTWKPKFRKKYFISFSCAL